MVALFIPEIPYLADRMFIDLALFMHRYYDEFVALYFHPVTPSGDTIDDVSLRDEVNDTFDFVYELEDLKNRPKDTGYYKSWQKEFASVIKAHKPDVIFFVSGRSFTFRLCKSMANSIPRIVAQPATRFYANAVSGGLRPWLRYFYYSKMLGIPVSQTPGSMGFDDPQSRYLFWSAFWYPPKNVNDGNNCYSVGPLAFQHLKANGDEPKANGRDLPKSILVLLGKRSKTPWGQYRQILELLKSTIQLFATTTFIFKVHPQEDPDFFYQYFDQEHNIDIKTGLSTQELIRSSSIVLSPWSTSVYEAMFLEKPVIILNPNRIFDLRKIIPSDYPYVISNLADAGKWVSHFISDEYLESETYVKTIQTSSSILIGDRNQNAYLTVIEHVKQITNTKNA